tara:strand:- start:44305 stop:44907 length:603 start_codon:yes stop_codon:yes gene_type:complete
MRRFLVFIFLILTVISVQAATQTKHESPYDQNLKSTSGDWWLNWGVGGGLGNHTSGVATLWGFNYQLHDDQIISARMSGLYTTPHFGQIHPIGGYLLTPLLTHGDNGYIGDTDVMYGYIKHWGKAIVTAQAGLGYVQWRANNGPDGAIGATHSTVGVPFESQLFWSYNHDKGIGIIFFGNLNTQDPYAALALALHFGHLY